MKHRRTTDHDTGPLDAKRSRSFSRSESGSVLVYIFIAVALLAALTYTFTKNTRSDLSGQMANKISQELYVQANLIRSAVIECTLAYPAGGGDLDSSGTIDTTDNPNTPYPLTPNAALNPGGAAANDYARNMVCVGAPAASRNIFGSTNNQGRFLPPPPGGYTEWSYINDSNGVRIKITAPNSASDINALNKLMAKFSTSQADLNYGGCGATCFTAWIQRL
jgi:hypothetical protein